MPFIVAFVLDFGLPLHLLRPTIYWNNVLALGVSSWSAGILGFLETRLYAPPKQFKDEEKSQSQKVIGPHNDMPQEQLDSLFDELDRLPKNMRLLIKSPGSIGNEVLQILTAGRHASKAPELKAAFRNAFALLDQIIVSWDTGETIVEAVPARFLTGRKHDICARSRKEDKHLRIFVGVDEQGGWTTTSELTVMRTFLHTQS